MRRIGFFHVFFSIKTVSSIFNQIITLFVSPREAKSIKDTSSTKTWKSSTCGQIAVFHKIISLSKFLSKYCFISSDILSGVTFVLYSNVILSIFPLKYSREVSKCERKY